MKAKTMIADLSIMMFFPVAEGHERHLLADLDHDAAHPVLPQGLCFFRREPDDADHQRIVGSPGAHDGLQGLGLLGFLHPQRQRRQRPHPGGPTMRSASPSAATSSSTASA